MEILKTFFLKWFTIPGFSSFKCDGSGFRVTGYYYRYYFSDGSSTDPILCKRSEANCIGGYGVCGYHIPFKRIERVSIKINRARLFFFKEYIRKSERIYREEYAEKIAFLKSLPPKLSNEEYEERCISLGDL